MFNTICFVIPENISNCLKRNGGEFVAEHCNLQYINLGDKSEKASLEIVLATGNNISKVDDELFKSSRNLTKIDLSKNQIDVVSDNAFRDQEKLLKLDLQGNKISQISFEILNGLVNLEILSLQNNKIEIIANDLFKANKNLKWIYLNENEIMAIGPQTFDGLNKLEGVTVFENFCVDEKYRTIVRDDDGNPFVEYSENFACVVKKTSKLELTKFKCVIKYDRITSLLRSDSNSSPLQCLTAYVIIGIETSIIVIAVLIYFRIEVRIFFSRFEDYFESLRH